MSFQHIIFDFDGVLAETNEIRFDGFQEVLRGYPAEQLAALDRWSRANGGLSRYVKLKHFFNNIRGEAVSSEKLAGYVSRYGEAVMQKVAKAPAVAGSVEFLAANSGRYSYAIISGADEVELRDVCRMRGVNEYFDFILGAPLGKRENIVKLLAESSWDRGKTVFVGDSINDYDAAEAEKIFFVGRNSGLDDWTTKAVPRITDLSELAGVLLQCHPNNDH